MTTKLTDLEIQEISLVKRAANGRPRFLILKADDTGDTMKLDEAKALEVLQAIDKAGMGEELEALAGADPVELATVVTKSADLSEPEQRKAKAAFRVLGKSLVEKLITLLTPAPKIIGTPVPGVPGVIKKGDGSYDFSGVPEASREIVKGLIETMDAKEKAAEQRASAIEKQLSDMRDRTERERFIQIVKGLDLADANPDDLAPALREISDKCPKAFERVLKVLTNTSAVIKELGLEEAVGSSNAGAGDGSASAELHKIAKGLIEKAGGEAKLSMADAIAQAATAHPDLYRRHQEEARREGTRTA